MRRSAFAAVAVMTTLAATAHAADEKKACLASYEQAQRLRADAKLRASLKELVTCARDVCPGMIKRDCGKWLEEADAALPSVVFAVNGPDGKEVTDVKVTVDEEVVATEITGAAVVLDPGAHRFRFERPGGAVVEEKFVIREGEKRRKLEVSFVAPTPAPVPTPAPTPPLSSSPSQAPPPKDAASGATSRPVPIAVWVLGGVGVAALGGFAVFAVKGLGEKSDLDACKGHCPVSQIDDNKTTFLIGDIFLGAAVVSLGVATVLYLTRPTETAPVARIDVRPTSGGATILWGGSF